MASNPLCPRCHSPMSLLAEEDSNWQFGCDKCKVAHVLSKPMSKLMAKEEVNHNRLESWRTQLKALKSKPIHFDFGRRKKTCH